MIRLAASEWLRFRSRRIVKVLSVLAIIGILVSFTIGAIQSKAPSDRELAVAQQQYERDLRSCLRGRFVREEELPPGQTIEEFCNENVRPEFFLSGDQLQLADLPEVLQGTSFLVILLGLVIGASMVGASWQAGTVTTLLTWEPRRIRVLLTRALIAAAGVFALAVLLQVVISLAMAAAAALRGSTAGADSGWLGEVILTGMRVGVVAAAVSAIGVAVAMIGRNTAAALGGVFVYMALLEGLVRGLRPSLVRFLLGDNIAVFVSGESTSSNGLFELTPGRGLMVLCVYAGALMLVALAFFRTRDVN